MIGRSFFYQRLILNTIYGCVIYIISNSATYRYSLVQVMELFIMKSNVIDSDLGLFSSG